MCPTGSQQPRLAKGFWQPGHTVAFATSAPGCLFFGLRGQQRRREAVLGAGDDGWPAGTAVVPVRSGIGLLGLGWRPIGRHRRRPGWAAGGGDGECDTGQPSGGCTGQNRCATLRLHPPPPCWLPLCCCCCKIVLASADSFLRYFAGFSGACRDAGGGAGADGRPDVARNC